jgi:hypothetical protein
LAGTGIYERMDRTRCHRGGVPGILPHCPGVVFIPTLCKAELPLMPRSSTEIR